MVRSRSLRGTQNAPPRLNLSYEQSLDVSNMRDAILGITLLTMGRYGEAQRYLERALRLRPGFPVALHNLALASIALGDGGNRNQKECAKSRNKLVLSRLHAAAFSLQSFDGSACATIHHAGRNNNQFRMYMPPQTNISAVMAMANASAVLCDKRARRTPCTTPTTLPPPPRRSPRCCPLARARA